MELILKDLTDGIIGAAIDVHRELGPGLLESAHEECLCHELNLRRIPFVRQRPLPISYKGVSLDYSYRLDLLVRELVVVEVKSVEEVNQVHEAQLLSYLKLGNWPVALLINFNVARLVSGITRRVRSLPNDLSVNSVAPRFKNNVNQLAL